ncbi:helix-turn-helix domain-containing protein [Oceanobacillus oncorhynchi]|uniref:helix-turn-helix domain-containing protein n=1 Tax=Oceanobacillus oncorhynchi TaxID=545501 RepID=UPI001867B4CB|nr:helix-turn-helix transcriptional regulator [Oceanobacillus oncorhynchi]
MSEHLSLEVRNELFKRKMNHKELAEKLGISGPYLSDILNGKRTGPKAQEHVKHIRYILDIK